MTSEPQINILLVDDQPGKLLSYEVILQELDANLIKANSATEALEFLLKNEIALVLVDVCMPDFDGFQLAQMIREHPRFQHIAMIFISAVQITDADQVRGYSLGAVDYVPVPVVPEVLRAKVRVFLERHRQRYELELLNRDLERRVTERTRELERFTQRLLESEQRRSLALAAGRMGSWDWDFSTNQCTWDEGQCLIFGVSRSFVPRLRTIRPFLSDEGWACLKSAYDHVSGEKEPYQSEFEIRLADGAVRWCIFVAAGTFDEEGKIIRVSGVSVDITERREAEERQSLLAREVDHRARNMLAVVHAIVRLTNATTTPGYVSAVEGRIQALSQTHKLLSDSRWMGADVASLVREELAPYDNEFRRVMIEGSPFKLPPDRAQTVGLAIHELATNAVKYGALSSPSGQVKISWSIELDILAIEWIETGGPKVSPPTRQGFGSRIINSSVRGQNGGNVSFDWRPEGLRVALRIPTGGTAAGPLVREVQSAAVGDLIQLKNSALKHILLVEDEALVGMMMREALLNAGFSVVGPMFSLTEAISTVNSQKIEAAILDVNLNGVLVYPLADLLDRQNIPYVFTTGYESVALELRFKRKPILQKPIEHENLIGHLKELLGQNKAERTSVSDNGMDANVLTAQTGREFAS